MLAATRGRRAIHGSDRTGRKHLPKRRNSTTNNAEITENPNSDQDAAQDETEADDDADSSDTTE